MAKTNLIPDKINRFNAYIGTVSADNKAVGVTDEVTLPNFTYLSETIKLAGSNGEIDSPTLGQFASIQMEIPFANIAATTLALAQDDSKPIILRSAQEFLDPSDNHKVIKQRVITVRGLTKGVNFGTLKQSGYGNPSVTKEVTYYKDELDGKTVMEVNKLTGRVIINGEDITKEIMDYI